MSVPAFPRTKLAGHAWGLTTKTTSYRREYRKPIPADLDTFPFQFTGQKYTVLTGQSYGNTLVYVPLTYNLHCNTVQMSFPIASRTKKSFGGHKLLQSLREWIQGLAEFLPCNPTKRSILQILHPFSPTCFLWWKYSIMLL